VLSNESKTNVVPKPERGAQKCKNSLFHLKLHFTRRKSATKFLCVNTVSDKVVRHSLAYLSMQKWFAGDVKIWQKLTHPLKNADFNQYSLVAPQP